MITASASGCRRRPDVGFCRTGAANAEASSLCQTSKNSFRKANRLSQERLIRHAVKAGERFNSEHLLIHRLALPDGPTTFCLSIPRRVGSAPERNRIKRLLREFLRTHKDMWPVSTALVIKVKQEAAGVRFKDLSATLTRYFQQ
jgi:ribonuclease P protein component